MNKELFLYLRKLYGGAGGGDHEHSVILPQDLIVDVNADHGVGPEAGRPIGHFVYGLCASLDELVLVGAATAADDVPNAGLEVADEVDAGDDFSENDALVFQDGASLDAGCGGEDHI